ncbi:MAG: hypothetical protein IKB78_09270, partial [Clostridia bacterium]|nr:hypothetical protein [Clostridia bacterium]
GGFLWWKKGGWIRRSKMQGSIGALLDAGSTASTPLFSFPTGMKMQTNPSSPTRKSPNALHSDFFSYIRLAASSIGFASDICFASDIACGQLGRI